MLWQWPENSCCKCTAASRCRRGHRHLRMNSALNLSTKKTPIPSQPHALRAAARAAPALREGQQRAPEDVRALQHLRAAAGAFQRVSVV